jgi:hypothetical protein
LVAALEDEMLRELGPDERETFRRFLTTSRRALAEADG